MKHIVIELQTDAEGRVANLVTAHGTWEEAQAKYHSVLAAAALSGLPMHAATLLLSDGTVQETRCFVREPEPGEPEPGETGGQGVPDEDA